MSSALRGMALQAKSNHWKDMVNRYEKRNASLECRQSQLSKRLQTLECTLPAVLMNAMVSMHRGTEPPRIDLESVLNMSGVSTCPCPPCRHPGCAACSGLEPEEGGDEDSKEIQLVYKRKFDDLEGRQGVARENCDGQEEIESAALPPSTTRYSDNFHEKKCPEACNENPPSCRKVPSADSEVLSIMSSQELLALGRIQELAEKERLLKKYISDLENREKTFHETLERANKLVNDPLECLECSALCPGAEVKEPLSDDPLMRRLQKLEFYNRKMLLGMKSLREEKRFLVKQTEMLKTQLRNTQEKLGEVQKEVLGEDKVMSLMEDPSVESFDDDCSCLSRSNFEEGKNERPATLNDLARKFEEVLKKAQSHGLCNLTGPIRETAMKLKQLGKSGENGCICDCPCEPAPGESKKRKVRRALVNLDCKHLEEDITA